MAREPKNDDKANPVPDIPLRQPLAVGRLPRSRATAFDVAPDADIRAELARFLDILKLRKLRFAGTLTPLPDGGWELSAELGATVVQPCSVTLEPVTTRIDEWVTRRFLPDLTSPLESETEVPQDTDAEALGREIDPAAVMIEALALALPPFPRAEGVELGEASFAAPGTDPLRDEDTKPLAGLAKLRGKLKP